MAIQIQNLDLEEQAQLDKIKHFWERWGNLISGVLIVALLGFAGWRGYDWYQSRQAGQASALFDQVRTFIREHAIARRNNRIRICHTDTASRWIEEDGVALVQVMKEALRMGGGDMEMGCDLSNSWR